MVEEIITFDDIEIEKHEFHRYKNPIFSEDVDIENVLVSCEKTKNSLLVTCIIIQLIHYI